MGPQNGPIWAHVGPWAHMRPPMRPYMAYGSSYGIHMNIWPMGSHGPPMGQHGPP